MAKKKKLEFKQLDISAAFQGKDVFIEEKTEEVEVENKPITLWTLVDDIRKYKKGNLLEDEKAAAMWNNFMILKALASKTNDAFVLNYFNEYTGILSKEQLYTALLHLVPKDMALYPYIKNVKEEKGEYIDFVSRHFECSENEALEYINVMGDDWAKSIKNKFGDLL